LLGVFFGYARTHPPTFGVILVPMTSKVTRTVRFPRELYVQLQASAAQKGLTVNAEIVQRLLATLESSRW
jgi:hypothetical protein